MLYISFFGLACLLAWYENYCIVMPRYNIPRLWTNMVQRGLFRFLKRSLLLGGAIGVGHLNNNYYISAGMIAFYIAFSHFTLKKYYTRQIHWWVSFFMDTEREKYKNLNDEEFKEKAFEFAHSVVKKTTREYGRIT